MFFDSQCRIVQEKLMLNILAVTVHCYLLVLFGGTEILAVL